ncbi:hypothetical protein CCMSSC00406_0010344 [Pleurotus cornucopiae]|uniref:Uncharacterized protein n=1 Tax=Pleurotus cornucopiae TaxID=5321 RepID=A0ACB7IQB6_PLECO|nr:hypothetical protein CCMSSC00406_0010344 [Pleurotus cornucopiae]
MSKAHVLIASAPGCTGGAIAKALLQAGNFRLSNLVRESINKPAVKELTDAGAEVIVGGISDSSAKLQSYLEGVDVLISTVLRNGGPEALADGGQESWCRMGRSF